MLRKNLRITGAALLVVMFLVGCTPAVEKAEIEASSQVSATSQTRAYPMRMLHSPIAGSAQMGYTANGIFKQDYAPNNTGASILTYIDYQTEAAMVLRAPGMHTHRQCLHRVVSC